MACGKCVAACPKKLINLIPDSKKVHVNCVNRDKGPEVMKVCSNGCIGCKMCEKTCKFDAVHVIDGVAKIDYDKCKNCKMCAKACPKGCIEPVPTEEEKAKFKEMQAKQAAAAKAKAEAAKAAEAPAAEKASERQVMDYLHPILDDAAIARMSSLALAHVGDAVYEVLVRSFLACGGMQTAKNLHRRTTQLVCAPAQAEAVQRILPLLDEAETGDLPPRS